MEKVTIASTKDTGIKAKNGNPIINVSLEDGRKCTAFTPEALTWTGEMELEIRPGQKFNDVQYYTILKPQSKGRNPLMQKDYTFEKRNASLQRSIETASLSKKAVNSSEILSVAEIYYQYLNKK